MFKKIFNNQSGFSLVEVMVAAGISSVVALSTMQISSNSQKAMRKAVTDSDMNAFFNFQFRSALSDSGVCIGELSGVANGMQPGDVSSNITLTTPSLTIGSGPFPTMENEFDVVDIKFSRTGVNTCQLAVKYRRTDVDDLKQRKIGAKVRTKFLNISCSYDDADTLIFCSSTDSISGGNSPWELVPETSNGENFVKFNDSTYPAVVIGEAANPAAQLTIGDQTPGAFNGSYSDGISMPNNYVIRWSGSPEAMDQGVSITGNQTSRCIMMMGNGATSIARACEDLFYVDNALEVAGDVSSGANVNASIAVIAPVGNLDVINSATINNTGVTDTGELIVQAGAAVKGTLAADGDATLNANTKIGDDVDSDNLAVNASAVFNGSAVFNNNISVNTRVTTSEVAAGTILPDDSARDQVDILGTIHIGNSTDGNNLDIKSQLGATAKNFYSWANPSHDRHVLHRGYLKCNAGQVGVINNGGFRCVNPPSCGTGQAMRGINDDWTAQCITN